MAEKEYKNDKLNKHFTTKIFFLGILESLILIALDDDPDYLLNCAKFLIATHLIKLLMFIYI